MNETSWIDNFDPEEIEIQAIDGFHHGGALFSASFELSDPYDEFGRSYLLEIELADTISFRVRLQIEDAIRSHVSFDTHNHVALELGGIVHTLTSEATDTRTELSEGVLHKLWAPSHNRLFAIGNRGVSYLREGNVWQQLENYQTATLNNIGGRKDGPVYMVGNRGLLLQLKETNWQQIELHTDEKLTAVLAGPNGELYLGGNDGTAYELRDSELIALKAKEADFSDIIEFRGKRYWSDSDYGVSVQIGQEIVPILETGQGFTMSASKDYLMVAGWKEFFLFDGSNWSGFELEWNGDISLNHVDMAQYFS